MSKRKMAKLAKLVNEVIKKPFEANYDGSETETITFKIDPVLSLQKRKDFAETVWNLYWSPSVDGTMDYRPYLLEPAIKLMTIVVYTDIELDMVEDFETCYKFAQYSGVYQDVLKAITKNGYLQDYQELIASTTKYVEIKTAEVRAIMQGNASKAENSVNDGLCDLIATLSGALSAVKESIQAGSGKETINNLIAKIVTGVSNAGEANNAEKILEVVMNNIPETVKDGEKVDAVTRGRKHKEVAQEKSGDVGEKASE